MPIRSLHGSQRKPSPKGTGSIGIRSIRFGTLGSLEPEGTALENEVVGLVRVLKTDGVFSYPQEAETSRQALDGILSTVSTRIQPC